MISNLKDPNPHVRHAAAAALGDIKDPRAVDPLIAALKDSDSEVRHAAAAALGDIKDPRAVDPLIAALKDSDSEVRLGAAAALGDIKDPRAVEPLIAALKDTDFRVRSRVALAFGNSKDARAVNPLIGALKDKDPDVRENAAETLGEIGTPAVDPLIAVLKDTDSDARANAADALGQIGTPAVDPLIAALKDPHSEVRQGAAAALLKTKDPRSVDPLIAALKDKDSQVRSNAALALGNTKDPRAVEPLIAALKDRDSNVREHVADALLIARHRSTEVNAIDKEGNTALNRADGHWSGDKEHEDLILALIDAGADVNATGKYGTPVIFNAARFGRLSVVKKLVEKGANLSFKTREGNIFGSGRTPLDLAASSEVWQYLRSKGAETGRTDYDKALFDAAKEGVPEAVAYFLQKGGNPNTKFDGDFADFSVTKMGGFNMPSLRVVKYRGITALHYACFGGVESVVRLLVENGASVSTADADAQTPLDFALFREHNDIVSYLRSVQAPEGVGGDGMHIRAAIENMPTGGWHQWRECSVMPNYNFLKERPDIKPMSLGHMKGTAIAFKGKWGSWDEEPVSFRNGMVGSCKAIPSYVKEGTEAKYLQRHYIFKKGDWAEVKE